MAISVTEPLVLVSPDLIPDVEVLESGRDVSQQEYVYRRELSDIFPRSLSYEGGELGVYIRHLDKKSPLVHTVNGLIVAASQSTYTNLEADNDTPEPNVVDSRKLKALKIQLYITHCISGAYNNVLNETNSKPIAVDTIKKNIEEQDEASFDDYNFEIDERTRLLLADLNQSTKGGPNKELLDGKINGIPTYPSHDESFAEHAPVSSEALRKFRVEYMAYQIRVARMRIERLRFEYLSAVAITRILSEAVGQSDPVAIE